MQDPIKDTSFGFANAFIHIGLAFLASVGVSNALDLGLVTLSGVPALAGLTIIFTLCTMLALGVMELFFVSAFQLKSLGFVLETLLTTMAGAGALVVCAKILPGVILVGAGKAIAVGLANSLMVWALAILSGTVDLAELELFPSMEM